MDPDPVTKLCEVAMQWLSVALNSRKLASAMEELGRDAAVDVALPVLREQLKKVLGDREGTLAALDAPGGWGGEHAAKALLGGCVATAVEAVKHAAAESLHRKALDTPGAEGRELLSKSEALRDSDG